MLEKVIMFFVKLLIWWSDKANQFYSDGHRLITSHQIASALIAMFVLFLFIVIFRMYEWKLKEPNSGAVYKPFYLMGSTILATAGWAIAIFYVTLTWHALWGVPGLDNFFNIIHSSIFG